MSSSNEGVQVVRCSGVQAFRRSGRMIRPSPHLNAQDHRFAAVPPERLNAGFTLIELMVVLIGLVIVAAAVVPALRGAGHQQDLTGTAARVEASARFARDEAVRRQATILLTVEQQPAAVRLAVDNTPAPNGMGPVGMMPASGQPANVALSSSFALVRLPTRIQARLEPVPETMNGAMTATTAANGEVDSLRFPPDGRSAGGAVVLTDSRGRTLRVVVTPDTGVVQVEAGSG
jgi:prepilin-type N-terminal cleavage/methylation domain-containing protein